MLDNLTILNIISFLLIFFIGLPHGSFDGAIASLVGFNKRIQFLQFLFYYLALFFLVILFWLYFPITGLTIFIIMTIVHFGLCDWTNFKINKYKYSVSFTYGMTIIFGIIFFNENQSFLIFEYLTNDKIYLIQKYFFIPYSLTLLSIIYFTLLSFFEKRSPIVHLLLNERSKAATISDFVSKNGTNLLAMVYHEHFFLEKLFREPVILDVTHYVDAPLLILPDH